MIFQFRVLFVILETFNYAHVKPNVLRGIKKGYIDYGFHVKWISKNQWDLILDSYSRVPCVFVVFAALLF